MDRQEISQNTKRRFKHRHISLYNDDVLNLYKKWASPTVIISDGPYGLNSYDGDLQSPDSLSAFYEPHVKEWTSNAKPNTTLWFWNSELGWATVHSLLAGYGWRFVNCHIWNKGMAHVAGNTNTKTLRKFPIVTEVCVQYVREPKVGDLPMRDWLRREWIRTGLPLSEANTACNVNNAATRKYLTNDHMWYFPPPGMFEKLATYANMHGAKKGMPYFALDGKKPSTRKDWEQMRAKFRCRVGVTNVWDKPPVNGIERIRDAGNASMHPNQKPLSIMKMIMEASSDTGDLVWEPFGGMCTSAIAALKLKRRCKSAEINANFYQMSVKRLVDESAKTDKAE